MTLAPNLFVRSLQEQRIANWLWEHDINFEYESTVAGLRDSRGKIFSARPDFYYPDVNTYHEHLAIKSNGSSPFDGYLERTASKRAAYSESKIDYFETTAGDAKNGSLINKLQSELVSRGITPKQRPFNETLKAVSPVVLRRYHTLLLTCIQHVRAGKLTSKMLKIRADELRDTKRAGKFIDVVMKVTTAYEQRLAAENAIDFDSMIGDAAELVSSGRFKSPYKLILVDEFQDISGSRARLVRSIRNQSAYTKLFTVGDDWQSIYRFTGSDVTLFTDFAEHFGESWLGKLETTFRSNQTIATAAANFIKENPGQVSKTVTAVRDQVPNSIRAIPVKSSSNKYAFRNSCDKLLERINQILASRFKSEAPPLKKFSVLILGRYKHLEPTGLALERSHISAKFMTFHKAKGLEADYVVLLDVSEGSYGVPSQIEDDELLNLVIPRPENYPYAEERRLFYVAITRASRGVFILYNHQRPSRYIAELNSLHSNALCYETVDGEHIDVCPECGGTLITRRSRRDKSIFKGCSNFPNCRHTQPI